MHASTFLTAPNVQHSVAHCLVPVQLKYNFSSMRYLRLCTTPTILSQSVDLCPLDSQYTQGLGFQSCCLELKNLSRIFDGKLRSPLGWSDEGNRFLSHHFRSASNIWGKPHSCHLSSRWIRSALILDSLSSVTLERWLPASRRTCVSWLAVIRVWLVKWWYLVCMHWLPCLVFHICL